MSSFGSHCGTVSVAAGANRLRILDIKSDLDLRIASELEIYTKLRIRNGLRWRTKGRGASLSPDNRVQIYVNDNVLTICISVAPLVHS